MRRLQAVWLYTGSWTNVTDAAAAGTATTALAAGNKLYVGSKDWLAGLLVEAAGNGLAYTVEQYDEQWLPLPLEETYEPAASGDTPVRPAYDLARNGAIYWGDSPYVHRLETSSATFPEATPPTTGLTLYWYRLTVTSGSTTLARVTPLLYNTYTTPDAVSRYLGVDKFTDATVPDERTVRDMIRDHEDWWDQYTRRTWRLRAAFNEQHDFNAFGISLRRQPPREVTRVRIWDGGQLLNLIPGRSKDYFLDRSTGLLRFTAPSMRMQTFSFVLSRFLRQPAAVNVDYVYGQDFDMTKNRKDVEDSIKKLVGADLVLQSDWTGMMSSGLDTVPKQTKVQLWVEQAKEKADELRDMAIA